MGARHAGDAPDGRPAYPHVARSPTSAAAFAHVRGRHGSTDARIDRVAVPATLDPRGRRPRSCGRRVGPARRDRRPVRRTARRRRRGLEDAGRAIVRSGDSVDGLSDVPLVGEGFATLADEIRGLGRDTAGGVVFIEDDIDGLALLVGAGLALGPTIPVLVLWVPPRVSRSERRALTRSPGTGDGLAMAYLANRAVATRGFRELQRASADPVGDLASGRYEALAKPRAGSPRPATDAEARGTVRHIVVEGDLNAALTIGPRSPTRGRGRATRHAERSTGPTTAPRLGTALRDPVGEGTLERVDRRRSFVVPRGGGFALLDVGTPADRGGSSPRRRPRAPRSRRPRGRRRAGLSRAAREHRPPRDRTRPRTRGAASPAG